MAGSHSPNELLPHLFRLEYAKMTAVLCRHFGLQHIEIAEDIASDTFLKASENWALKGIPENPTAWLYTVARNKAKDYLRHSTIVQKQLHEAIGVTEYVKESEFEFSQQTIADSQLAMIFVVCNPGNSTDAQICLALQILCGFSIEEIANAFLTKPETIKKRLQRARTQLRKENFQIKNMNTAEIKTRLETVLRTVYLLFNEGYSSRTNDLLIRKELCSEAVRLTLVLQENPSTNVPQTNALLALMCFQSSRLDARTDDNGEVVLFEEQDKSLWDKSLIEKGNYFLVNACHGNEISKYHLEAGIAYWHTTPTDENKWQHILQLYDQLVRIDNSPVTVLNRLFAFARVHGSEIAIEETTKLELPGNYYYHGLLGYLYTNVNANKAIFHYEHALLLSKSKNERQTLAREIARLRGV